jgi:hypothetical protein
MVSTHLIDPLKHPSPKSAIHKLAKQLCYSEGMAWSLRDFEKGVSGVTVFTVVVDEKKKQGYLNRARLMLNLRSD